EDLPDCCRQLRERDLERVALEDPGQLLEVRREGAVSAAVAVRQRPPPHDAPAGLADETGELDREAGLAEPGLPEDRDQVRLPVVDGALPHPAQRLELALPADQRQARQAPF